MATVQWVIFRHHKRADGTYNPKIAITHKRKTAYFSTGIYTPLVRFKRGDSQGTPTDRDITRALDEKVDSIRDFINSHTSIIDSIGSAQEVRDYVISSMNKRQNTDVLAFADGYLSKIKVRGTFLAKQTRINAIRDYVKNHLGLSSLPAEMITSNFIKEYEEWLRTHPRKGIERMKESTVISYIGELSALFNAFRDEYNDYDNGDIVIKNDPFRRYKYPRNEETEKKAISPEVIRSIWDYKPSRHTAQVARDVFLMSFFLCGINVADLYECAPFGDRLEYTRKKTRNTKKDAPFISMKIHDKIKPILDRYRDGSEKGFLFHRMFRDTAGMHQSIRSGMKYLTKEVEGTEGLTFYAARHSFATIARNDCGVSMDDIALCLTHDSGHSITDTYIKKDYSRIDSVIDKVVQFVFGDKA